MTTVVVSTVFVMDARTRPDPSSSETIWTRYVAAREVASWQHSPSGSIVGVADDREVTSWQHSPFGSIIGVDVDVVVDVVVVLSAHGVGDITTTMSAQNH